MTSEYMNNLYRDLLSNSPQTVTIPIPSDMGTGQIAQVVTKQGAVVSDWKMNYFSDMNVRGINSEDYIQMLFCLNDGVSWNIAGMICANVSNPVSPGIFSSRKIMSNDSSLQHSMASCPLITGITSYPLSCRKRMWGFNKSISSSAQSTLSFFAAIVLSFFFEDEQTGFIPTNV